MLILVAIIARLCDRPSCLQGRGTVVPSRTFQKWTYDPYF